MAYQFKNDYSELAHPDILNALMKYSKEQNVTYGLDYHSKNAEELIKKTFNSKNGKVYFFAGGTQTNMTFISYCLKPYEAVISINGGHINVHETGSVEGSGHKIIAVNGRNGKIYPKDIIEVMNSFNDEHMVKPKMVYISNSTEIGTIYSKQELLELREITNKYGLYLFLDGARLASALTSKENDVDPTLLGEIVDAFYVGGTKNGLLFGEALVVNNPKLQEDFRYHIKNKGAMLAKGYAVGIQFEEAFRSGLYFELAKKANLTADMIREAFKELNIKMIDSPTNQVFGYFKKDKALKIVDKFGVEIWSKEDDVYCLRFVTSFLSEKEDIDVLINYLREI